ncbi:2-dehydro-3-deoxyphosphooctonate aldolase [Thermoanaerobaculum aquaticum]|uniref:2-dehydro-3-deoxyphosphooctonate aldolase n=1 Tax=Thermoanaerobaculum aquaticum TaxID=1312852 RepID=A0A062XYK1_9BACT|nr:3-deoxy-8-phosphooctulonate synthase [Thermoanaerobaculum aquaticum]KDA53211.1 2-dehydro-3-deoxyphosphooctonate aldolase [Thermoanaerobaculum aquaticum]
MKRVAACPVADRLTIGEGQPLAFIAGPCVLESLELALDTAGALAEMAREYGIPLIFKSSFDKANRSSLASFRGPGLETGLSWLAEVKKATGLPVLTDVHEPWQAERAAEVVDVLQVPAFLCRQTDLILACARTGKAVNVKKGQFMAPDDMKNVVQKVTSTGNTAVTLTERGSSFGYHNLVVDLRSLAIMRQFAPVIFDVTHSLQLPGGLGHATAGDKQFFLHLARGAVACGIDGLFAEVHPQPEKALSDPTTQLSLPEFRKLIEQALAVRAAVAPFTERP